MKNVAIDPCSYHYKVELATPSGTITESIVAETIEDVVSHYDEDKLIGIKRVGVITILGKQIHD